MKSLSGQKKWRFSLIIVTLCAIMILGNSCFLSNNDPVIYRLQSEKEWVELSGNSKVECIAFDSDEDELAYQWTTTGGNISRNSAVVTWTAPDTPGTYTISTVVTDGRGGEVTSQLILEARANHPPVIENLTAERMTANRAESIIIECTASDADGDDLAYSWSANGGTFYVNGPITAWMAPEIVGTYTITAEVTDDRGGKATMPLTIAVTVNHPPVIESLTAESLVVSQNTSVNIECIATDPDGDQLTYSWEATEGDISGEGANIIWTGPDICAMHTITVTVADGRGGAASKEINVRVKKPG